MKLRQKEKKLDNQNGKQLHVQMDKYNLKEPTYFFKGKY